ncbi:ABC transporter permease subunit [Modestobacter sp. NPDC049651]|uniref:ABC transporter permease subunit n=1 Tax=unclassified Modestobacter TaxID=2643866 RepID=UPI0033EB938C
MVSAELTKLLRRPATWVLLGLWPSLQLVFSTVIPYSSYRRGSAYEGSSPEALLAQVLPDRLVENALSGLPLFGGALLLTLGALLAGSEYGWRTLGTLLTQGPRRRSVLTAQLLALLVVLAGTVVVSLLVTAVASRAIAGIESAPVAWPSAARLTAGFGGGLLIALTWGVLGMLLGTALRGTALPVGLGLVWVLAVENLVVNVAAPLLGFFDAAQAALPGVNAGSLVAALAGPGATLRTPGVAATVGGTQAALVLGGFLVAAVALTGLLLVRRDVS